MKLLIAGLLCVALVLPTEAAYAPRFRRQVEDRLWWGRPTSTTTTAAPIPPSAETLRRCMNTCLSTNEYNPLCGTDGQTYSNIGRMMCAQNCGTQVQVLFRGSCQPLT